MMYSIRNVEDGQTISLAGGETNDGSLEFCIGLTLDESLVCSNRRDNKTVSVSGDASVQGENQHIVVPLVMLTVWKNSGVTVCPASRDLRCRLNGDDVDKEAHIIPGSQIEVADKTLELVEGLTAERPRPHRRHLPPTPGVPILPSPPPKPQRSSNGMKPSHPPPLPQRQNTTKKDTLKEELREWCLVQLPNSEQELIEQVRDPDQLASLASSYLTRHINIHTDIAVTTDMADRIAKMMQEVAYHRKEIMKKFLSDVISDVMTQDNDDLQTSLNSSAKGTQHATVTCLLVEILRQFLDPQYLVLLCLQLLRALSHIPGNVFTLVTSQTTSAVLGSMAVFRDDEDIQNFCLDILAKMATYVPPVLAKPPMRESSIELVVMAMTLHDSSLSVVAASIRVLANLATSLHSLAFNAMIGSPSSDLRDYVAAVLEVLNYLYQNTSHRVRSALADCGQDLNIKMDGRRFMFEYAKMDQLRHQHQLWEVQPDSPLWPFKDEHKNGDVRVNDIYNGAEEESRGENYPDEEEGEDNITDNNASGILKKSRSFENLRTPDRKVFFQTQPGGDDFNSSTSSSSSSSSACGNTSSPVENQHSNRNNGSGSPDIQVLSRSRIYPITLSPVPSDNSGEISNQLPPFPSSTTTAANEVTTPPTPNAPIRRPIQAPLVHINSQSDSEAEPVLDSPMSKFNKDKNEPISEIIDNPDDRYADIANLDVEMKNFDLDHYSDSSTGLMSDGSTSLSSSSPLPSSQRIASSSQGVDLTGFVFTSADVLFMKRLMCIQVTCHICAASIRGSDPIALKLIDLPLTDLLQRPGIPKAVLQFALSQFDPNASLMDIDPGTVISIIDAVRYKMLAFELVRKSLQALLKRLSPSIHQKIVLVAGELFHSVAMESSLSPIVEDTNFVNQLQTELKDLKAVGFDRTLVAILMECLQPVTSNSQAR